MTTPTTTQTVCIKSNDRKIKKIELKSNRPKRFTNSILTAHADDDHNTQQMGKKKSKKKLEHSGAHDDVDGGIVNGEHNKNVNQ